MAHDITEVRKAERRVDVVQAVNGLKEEFIATASHNLNGPLNSGPRAAQRVLERILGRLNVVEYRLSRSGQVLRSNAIGTRSR